MEFIALAILACLTFGADAGSLGGTAPDETPTAYRVAWRNPGTGVSGHGAWLESRELAQQWVDVESRLHPGIVHHVESATPGD